MKKLISIAILAATLTSVNAFASYRRMAECTGRTDKNIATQAVLFVSQPNDTEGLVVVAIDRSGVFASDTKVDWNANPQGYPRFHDNDFDLDIVINDKTASRDDVLVGDHYVSQLNCVFKP